MQMIVLLLGWISVVAVIDGAVTRPWKSAAARAPLPVALAVIFAAWVLATGAYAYADSMAQGAWTGATIAIAFVPIKAVILSLLAYAAGRTFLTARATSAPFGRRWGLPILLAGISLYILASDVVALHKSTLERHARDPALTTEEVAVLLQRIHDGKAGEDELSEFLGNPLCPPGLLAEYASSSTPHWRMAVARNQKIDAVLADKLANDPNENVRYYIAFNPNLPPEAAARLAADSSEMVRNAAKRWAKP